MFRLRTFVILIVIYLIAFVSIKFDLNLFYPYDLMRNYLLMPVIAIAKNSDVSLSSSYNETLVLELKKEIASLKALVGVKTVLSDYENINATVIGRNRNYWFNTITIDKGTADGITLDMAVIDGKGLIGKISYVSKNMSEIKLLTTSDVNNKTSVMIVSGEEKIYGIIDQYNEGYLEVTLTSKNEQIKEGLQVTTTGMGGIYPSGILIGETMGIKTSKYDVGLIVLVKPTGEFNHLKYVSVLKRK